MWCVNVQCVYVTYENHKANIQTCLLHSQHLQEMKTGANFPGLVCEYELCVLCFSFYLPPVGSVAPLDAHMSAHVADECTEQM